MSNSEPTLPGTPSNPTYRSSESEVDTHATGTHIVKRLFWSVAQSATTPRDQMKYNVQVIRSTERTVATADRSDVCETASSATTLSETVKYAVVDAGDVVTANGLMGIEITASDAPDLITDDPADDYYFYACVRANPDEANGGNDEGAWAISSGQKFTRKPPAAPSSVRAAVGDPATSSVELTWSTVSAADTYDVEWSIERDFASNAGRRDGVSDTEHTVENLTPDTTYYFRVRSTAADVGGGGRNLEGSWRSTSRKTAAN